MEGRPNLNFVPNLNPMQDFTKFNYSLALGKTFYMHLSPECGTFSIAQGKNLTRYKPGAARGPMSEAHAPSHIPCKSHTLLMTSPRTKGNVFGTRPEDFEANAHADCMIGLLNNFLRKDIGKRFFFTIENSNSNPTASLFRLPNMQQCVRTVCCVHVRECARVRTHM